MRIGFGRIGFEMGPKGSRRLRIGAVMLAALALVSLAGRLLIASASTSRPGARAPSTVPISARSHPAAPSGSQAAPAATGGSSKAASSGASSANAAHSGAGQFSAGSTAPGSTSVVAPVEPVGPDIVRTATVDLRVATGTVGSEMSKVALLAASNGGYVNSSSLSGGTERSAPVSGQMVVRVESADLTQVLGALAGYGRISSEQVSGQDVTGQVADNAATIAVLQQEVNLLQSKLSQATDINTFLQVEGQLAPIQQQLQQLESQQSVLQNSVALASVTVDMLAPGAPVPVPNPVPKPQPNAARVAWRYATHNSLVVLDGLAVGAGWALPLLALGGLAWLVVTRVVRRKRPGVSTV